MFDITVPPVFPQETTKTMLNAMLFEINKSLYNHTPSRKEQQREQKEDLSEPNHSKFTVSKICKST